MVIELSGEDIMAKGTLYFSHDCNSRNDRKMVKLKMRHGMEGVGIYWCIVEMLYEEGGYLPLEYDRITYELRVEENVLAGVINDFDLFVIDGNKFYSESVLERLTFRAEKSEKARKSIYSRWQRSPDSTVLPPKNGRNTNKDKDKDKDKDKQGQQKVRFLDDVYLSDQEVLKLKTKLDGNFDLAVSILNNYKLSKGMKYKSDYHAILNWVIKRVEEENPKGAMVI